MNKLIALSVLFFVAYLLAAPTLVNGDGLGYLRAAAGSTIYPGHIAYVAFLRAAGFLVGATRPIDFLAPARLLSAGSAALAVFLTGRTAQTLVEKNAGLVAAAGLGVSFGTLACGSDVESYAPALCGLTAAIYCCVHKQWVGAAIATALATLFHVENVLFLLPLGLLVPRPRRLPVVAFSATLIAAPYGILVACFGRQWLLSARHGFSYPLRLANFPIALYGAAKAIVYSPYLYQASLTCVSVSLALGLCAIVAVMVVARPWSWPMGKAAMIGWLLSYGGLAILFFSSDQERYVFLLPLFWLVVASGQRRFAVALVITCIGVANGVLWLPRAKDATDKARAHAIVANVHVGDLVICPGHSWDEYVGFYERVDVEMFPIVYYAGKLHEMTRVKEQLASAIARARDRHARIFLVRWQDSSDANGWKELALFGVTPSTIDALLPSPTTKVIRGESLTELF